MPRTHRFLDEDDYDDYRDDLGGMTEEEIELAEEKDEHRHREAVWQHDRGVTR